MMYEKVKDVERGIQKDVQMPHIASAIGYELFLLSECTEIFL